MAVAYLDSVNSECADSSRRDAASHCAEKGYGELQPSAGKIRWYALRTRGKHEKIAHTILQNKGYETFLPLYRCRRRRLHAYSEVDLPVFPGYLFCRFDPVTRLPILTTPGIVEVIGAGRIPLPIPDFELDAIRRLVSTGLPSEPWPYLEIGQKIYVQGGPLRGIFGILVGKRCAHRLIVSVSLLRRSMAVEIAPEWVVPAAVASSRLVAASAMF
jgi:hypothetical protein